ncbi:MAG: acyl-CoA dehydratase activase-related protein [Prevotellaceae bacterium]|jgi:predicted CoA-substrate-specific enzyme activase|nr:acyl-CoA dehydratase activase-related protein [Prevotellaceae bacterium]
MTTKTIPAYRAGMDIGSTTVKLVIVDGGGGVLFSDYRRHNADLGRTIMGAFFTAFRQIGDCTLDIAVTGSVGMGIAERFGTLFIQEVVASVTLMEQRFPEVKTFIDIGGEDAKMIFFRPGQSPDIRMNGSCAGGTGAFIDQMAGLLGVQVNELSSLAGKAEKAYPIASRCGVFSKTDVQNLISRNVSKADIAASIFHAVAMQTISALSRGYEIAPPVFFCGGPLAFIPALHKAFETALSLPGEQCIFDKHAHIVPAWGCAVSPRADNKAVRLSELLRNAKHMELSDKSMLEKRLPKLFENRSDFENWRKKKCNRFVDRIAWEECRMPCYLGIDSGSTTTKIVVTDHKERVLFDYYARNEGNPLQAVINGLDALRYAAEQHGVPLAVAGSAVTGYGENLIKAAFNLDFGLVETIAHYLAARKISPEVSFILDIGGQDMKALFIENGAIRRLEINEACSSGCGSFIEGFANMLNLPVAEFADMACRAETPCDLGTRCTVFMNSKVKQALKENADIADIAAGLSYSVIKNCLYKVLKLKDVADLGGQIVVQGGAFRNLSIVRALEVLSGAEVSFSDIPELMGAYGAAIYAARHAGAHAAVTPLERLLEMETFATDMVQCHGCENHCFVKKFKFSNGNNYYSGNKCEKIFSNKAETRHEGANLYAIKLQSLFDRATVRLREPKLRIGIPRGLNMFENYPFWHTLLVECNLQPVLSQPSTYAMYEQGLRSVMSDNICFPAKLMHGHILNLLEQKVHRILFPYVVFEQKEDSRSANSYNCPVVTGYSDVIKAGMNTAEKFGVPIDAPTVAFNDDKLLYKACKEYLYSLHVPGDTVKRAFTLALQAQQAHFRHLSGRAFQLLDDARAGQRMVILLAGRPYHADPLVQHKVSEFITQMGVDVITEDIARARSGHVYGQLHAVSQWAYPNRIFKAAQFVADSNDNIHYVQLTSFGCGPDALVTDEVNEILKRKGKNLTLLKIDEVNNIGSLRLRIRSMVDSLRFSPPRRREMPFVAPPAFTKNDRYRKVIAPYFAEGYSELLPEIFKLMGVDIEILPPSDSESVTQGLRYVNNEICYPAILVVGDIVKALKSGKYNRHEIAVAITQTGGQCRATNYIASIKRAMQAAGFNDIPVVSVAFHNDIYNEQPGFQLRWPRALIITFFALLYADCLTKFYYAAVVREKEKGAAARLRYKYINLAKPYILQRNRAALFRLVKEAADEFNSIITPNDHVPIIGVVGEIYVKYNSFSHKNVLQWLSEQGVEVVAPSLYNFFISGFVNMRHNHHHHIKRNTLPLVVNDAIYKIVYYYARKFDRVAAAFRYYRPFSDLYEDAEKAAKIINLSAQFGEGWLIPAELAAFAESGVFNALSLQPFGCIANHIIAKGIEKRVREVYPAMQLLFLDFDADTSEANILNRLHFMIKHAKDSVA